MMVCLEIPMWMESGVEFGPYDVRSHNLCCPVGVRWEMS